MIVCAIASCSGTTPGTDDDDDDGDGDSPAGTLTTFVIDIIENQTVDNMPAMSETEFESLADPDADTNNLDAYNGLF
ncbi:MAG: hypothetical protein M4D80_12850 [Myxococcota bacterium]|nr:hypothetical protein [Deltaproteobacteria bacterium]MDQ3336050.1 hypothetical protein [Myxococcota bacterium]